MLGALIGAGASILGGLLGKSSADKAADANKKANAQQLAFAREQMERNEALQREFAQSGIQWKAADAKAAGISPIYAMGAPATNFSPMTLGYNPTPATGDTSMANAMSSAGQDIGRAVNNTRSQTAQQLAFTNTMQMAQLDSVKLDNEQKRLHIASQIAKNNNTGIPPGIPDLSMPFMLDGQGNGGMDAFKVQKQIAAADPKAGPQAEAGLAPEQAWYQSAGGKVPQIPQALGESFEGEPWPGPSGLQWFLRNKVAPMYSNTYFKPPHAAPKGKYWRYNPIYGQYELWDITPKHKMYFNRR